MRFNLTLTINKSAFGNCLPLNYQYACSAAIYKILSKSNQEFSRWLHENGFQTDDGKKKFKLFTFSRLQIPQFRIEKENIRILSDEIKWQISFLPERSTQEFIQGIFQNQTFELGTRNANVQFSVREISVMPPPVFTKKMTFETLSPICIAMNQDNGKQLYLSPENEDAERLVLLNLLDKYKAFYGEDFPQKDFHFAVKTLSKPKSTLITIKADTPQESKIRGFLCQFELQAPVELMKIAYEAGLGGKNSMGFGMVEEML